MTRLSAKARKYMAAIGGIGLLIAMRQFEIDIPGLPDLVRDLLIGVAMAEGVYQISNGDASK